MSDEKTEQPTAKRLRDAREKGEVAKSQEVSAALTVMAVSLWLLGVGSDILDTLMELGRIPEMVLNRPFDVALPLALAATLSCALRLLMPLLALVMAVALCANLGQVGFLFSMKAAMPKLENLSPSRWFGKVFSRKNLVELLKNIVKVAVIGAVAWKIFEKHLPALFRIPRGGTDDIWRVLGSALSDLLLMCAGAFCVVAAVDFCYQRWQFTKQHMMSKDEVKREFKESEGDPMIKGRRRQLHQELVAQGRMDNVRRARVLVTNPTHYAVALDYEKDRTPLPVILAKGEGEMARRMIRVAEEEGIPIMRDVALARGLFERGTENAGIPADLIGPVAEVLRWVQSLERK